MFDLPVTIVTGYLGSGKTTYINRRLKDAGGVRYASPTARGPPDEFDLDRGRLAPNDT